VDVVSVRGREGARDCDELVEICKPLYFIRFGDGGKTDILEQAQHLVISGVVWNEESNIGISQHCSDSDQASSSAGHYADVLPGVLAFFALPVVIVVEFCNGLSEGSNACGGSILACVYGDGNGRWSRERSFDLVVYFWSALSKVSPQVRLVDEAMFGCLLGTPVVL
jgi:hypothetical protein